MRPPYPARIVCLTAETTEIAFALGCGERVVGVSGYAVRPPEARRKPKVAAFSTAHVDRIAALEPDLVLAFSDLQADIVADLVKRGMQVLVTNQRTIEETYAAISIIAGALGAPERGSEIVGEMRSALSRIAKNSDALPRRPRVFFEEWDDPLITGIGWVSELIGLCGGEDVFAARSAPAASDRIVLPSEAMAMDPEVIVASWCGKRANLGRIAARPGWGAVSAVRDGRIYEIKAPDILQPGQSLVRGAEQLAGMIRAAALGELYAQTPGLAAK